MLYRYPHVTTVDDIPERKGGFDMYTFWVHPYFIAGQVGARLLSQAYLEWCRAIDRLTLAALGADRDPAVQEPPEPWLSQVTPEARARRNAAIVNCAAFLYSHEAFSLDRDAANAASWFVCYREGA